MTRKKLLTATIATLSVALSMPGLAQSMPDIGFESVGRGQPLPADVRQQPVVGPNWERGAGEQRLNGYRPEELPESIEPLAVDIFTTDDFYADQVLWEDPRYFRCMSGYATEEQWGALVGNPLILSDDPADGVWGNCDIDYPREAIVSPYGFETASEHYAALLEETEARGGPDEYSFKDFPAA